MRFVTDISELQKGDLIALVFRDHFNGYSVAPHSPQTNNPEDYRYLFNNFACLVTDRGGLNDDGSWVDTKRWNTKHPKSFEKARQTFPDEVPEEKPPWWLNRHNPNWDCVFPGWLDGPNGEREWVGPPMLDIVFTGPAVVNMEGLGEISLQKADRIGKAWEDTGVRKRGYEGWFYLEKHMSVNPTGYRLFRIVLLSSRQRA